MLITKPGLRRVDFCDTQPMSPEPEPPRTRLRLPTTASFRIGAALAGCGAMFIAAAAVRHWLHF